MRNHFLRAAAGNVAEGNGYFTYTDSTFSNSNFSTYTFSAMDIGAADADRWVVVCLGYTDSTASTVLNSVTIGGVSAEILIQRSNENSSQRGCAIAQANVPTGTAADVVANFSGTFNNCGCHVGTYSGERLVMTSYSDAKATTFSPWTTGTTMTPIGSNNFLLVNYFVSEQYGTAGAWTGVTSLAEQTVESTYLHEIATKDPNDSSSVTWEITTGIYAYGGAVTAIFLEQGFAEALPTSINNFNAGNPSVDVSSINEMPADTSTWIADTNNNTATIGFGNLTIASSGPCRLEFYMTVYSSGEEGGIENNNGNTLTSMNNGAIGGYAIFSSLGQTETWTKYTYDFDASNISSGTINFTWTNVRDGGSGDRTGPAIGWARFIYPPG